MRVALYTSAIREASFTHRQKPPPGGIEYTSFYDQEPDVLLATAEMANWLTHDRQDDRTPKVLWLQESRWCTAPSRAIWPDFNLVLSNQAELVAAGATYMTLFGTWITQRGPEAEAVLADKARMVSTVASAKANPAVAGYFMRRQVRKILVEQGLMDHGYGSLYGRVIPDKWYALAPYRFHVVVESERYDWWATEKLWDCFATKSLPLYWGCPDLSKLASFGYDTAGILPWETPDQLRSLLMTLDSGLYDSLRPAIEANYCRVMEDYCAEVPLARILTEKLCLKPHSS